MQFFLKKTHLVSRFDVKPDWNIYSGEACVSFTYWVQHTTKVWIHSEHALFPNPPDSDLETGVHLTLYPYNKQGIKQVGYAEVSGMAGDEVCSFIILRLYQA